MRSRKVSIELEILDASKSCYIPWQFVKSWECTFCGYCCKSPIVHLNPGEQIIVTALLGKKATMIKTIGRRSYVFLKKNSNGCIFLYRFEDKWLCRIYESKPMLCMLWPFIVCNTPKYGKAQKASFYYDRKRFFIYVDPHCIGLKWGKPQKKLIQRVLPKAIHVRFGG